MFAVVAALPDGLTGVFEVLYRLGPIVAGVLAVSALVARRARLLLTLLLAFAVALASARSSRPSSTSPRPSGRRDRPRGAQPGLPRRARSPPPSPCSWPPGPTSPGRPAAWSRSCSGSPPFAAVYLAEGLPVSVLASMVLSWGAAAVAHFAFGSPGGTPALHQVAGSLRDLGVPTDGAPPGPRAVVGPHRLRRPTATTGWPSRSSVGTAPTPACSPSSGASSGTRTPARPCPSAAASRSSTRPWSCSWPSAAGLGSRTWSPSGIAGARDDALLVVRNPPGRTPRRARRRQDRRRRARRRLGQPRPPPRGRDRPWRHHRPARRRRRRRATPAWCGWTGPRPRRRRITSPSTTPSSWW